MNVQCQRAINNVFSNHMHMLCITLILLNKNYTNLCLGNLVSILDTPLQALAEA